MFDTPLNPHQMTPAEKAAFRRRVYRFFRAHGRDLPWRRTTDPYCILVSEIMLQQTQVDRVIPKYSAFINAFPNIHALAESSQHDVLALWSGLGYNRRGRMLHQLAGRVVSEYGGAIPSAYTELVALPGVGPYTANAIRAFALDKPAVLIETNIRTVFIHTFFPETENVSDADIKPLIEATLDTKRPREWYAALMDYGAHLKKTKGNANSKSRHYAKQPRFAGSSRELRGAILRLLIGARDGKTAGTLAREAGRTKAETEAQITALLNEGFLEKRKHRYVLV